MLSGQSVRVRGRVWAAKNWGWGRKPSSGKWRGRERKGEWLSQASPFSSGAIS